MPVKLWGKPPQESTPRKRLCCGENHHPLPPECTVWVVYSRDGGSRITGGDVFAGLAQVDWGLGMTATAPTLPALRHLGDLADMRPCIIIDTREQAPLPIARLPVVRGTLATGDYSVNGLQELFAVERKTIPDLVACCVGDNRDRFERELHRLRGFRFKRLLIVGTRTDIEAGRYRSRINPRSVLHSLSAWECRYDLPAVFMPTAEAAARQVESWAFWFAREHVEAVNGLLRAPPTDTPNAKGHTP